MKSKYFIDAIKLVAYRAETAMVNIVRRTMNYHHQDEARSLLRSIYSTEADILPDHASEKLIVRLHQPANKCNGLTIKELCRLMTATNTKFPGTNLRLVYEMVS